MDELQKKVQAARQQRKDGTRIEVAPILELSSVIEAIGESTGLPLADSWMVVTVMGPEGCQVESKEMAALVLAAGGRALCEEVMEQVRTRGFNGEEWPFDVALVRQNSWFKIPFEVGTNTKMVYHEEEMQVLWNQKAGDVDLLGGAEFAQKEGVRRFFAGFK